LPAIAALASIRTSAVTSCFCSDNGTHRQTDAHTG
jgi:hypothetical protein